MGGLAGLAAISLFQTVYQPRETTSRLTLVARLVQDIKHAGAAQVQAGTFVSGRVCATKTYPDSEQTLWPMSHPYPDSRPQPIGGLDTLIRILPAAFGRDQVKFIRTLGQPT